MIINPDRAILDANKIQASRSYADMAADALSRANDGIFRMMCGHDGREYALRQLSFALDYAEKAKTLLSEVPIFRQGNPAS